MRSLYPKSIGMAFLGFLCLFVVRYATTWHTDYISYATAGAVYVGMGYLAKRYHWSKVYHVAFWLPIVFFSLFGILVNPANFPSVFPFEFAFSLIAYMVGLRWADRPVRYGLLTLWVGLFCVAGFLLAPHLAFQNHQRDDRTFSHIQLRDWELLRLDSTPLPFELAKNKVVLLNFTFQHCGQCIVKQPTFEKLVEKFKSNPYFLALEVDLGKFDTLKEARIFAQKYPNTLTWAYDPKNKLAYQLQFEGAPHEVLLDKNGRVRYMNSGFNGNMKLVYVDRLSATIEQLLKE